MRGSWYETNNHCTYKPFKTGDDCLDASLGRLAFNRPRLSHHAKRLYGLPEELLKTCHCHCCQNILHLLILTIQKKHHQENPESSRLLFCGSGKIWKLIMLKLSYNDRNVWWCQDCGNKIELGVGLDWKGGGDLPIHFVPKLAPSFQGYRWEIYGEFF